MQFNEMANTCRSCMTEASDLRSIYKMGKICGEITKLSSMLNWFTGLEITEGDGLPEHICTKCVLHVSRAYAFKQLCIKSDKTLHERLDTLTKLPELTIEIRNNAEISDSMETDDNPDKCTAEEYIEENAVNEEDEIEELLQTDNEIYIKEEEILEENVYNERKPSVGFEMIQLSSSDDQLNEDFPNYDDGSSEISVLIETIDSDDDKNDDHDDGDDYDNGDEDAHINRHSTEFARPKMIIRKYRNRSKTIKKPPYNCEICSKVLSTLNSYKYHIQLHSDRTPYLCSDCGKGFKTRNSYEGHRITHNDNNPNTCTICRKSYRQAASLRSHMLSHSGEKPFLCGICGKGMTQKSGFKKHMLTHTGERPYTCDICNKPFRYSSNLIMHKRAHLGEKRCTCKICDKSFIGSEHLKRHAMTHTGEKPFSCEFCGKCFNRKYSMQVHQATHSGLKKFPCNDCTLVFHKHSELLKHLNSSEHKKGDNKTKI